jgi:hypothetical protein
MNVTCIRAGRDWVVLNAQHDVIGVLKSFEDSWKVEVQKPLTNDPTHPANMKLMKGGD